MLILYFEKFSTWILRLPFAVNVKLKLSIACFEDIYFRYCIQQSNNIAFIYLLTLRLSHQSLTAFKDDRYRE